MHNFCSPSEICRKGLALAACLLAFTAFSLRLHAQDSLLVLHSFPSSGSQINSPMGPLVSDGNGNVFGTAPSGVFELANSGNGNYAYKTIYTFPSGYASAGGVGVDANGNLFGTTIAGGANNAGTVFELSPNGGNYQIQTLWSFTGGDGGSNPYSNIAVDAKGDLFGTTSKGGGNADGTVFELVPQGNGQYTFVTLHRFAGADGQLPMAGVTVDVYGDVFGTTSAGGANGDGVVFELVPTNGSFTYSVLHSFAGLDGAQPAASVAIDSNGNLFGTTAYGGTASNGVVFEIASYTGYGPPYAYIRLYAFTGNADGDRPEGGVAIDSNGNLFGNTYQSGSGAGVGVAFELVNNGDGTYSDKTLYTFTSTGAGGTDPEGSVLLLDSADDILGSAATGGAGGGGTIWELSPSSTTSLALASSYNPAAEGDNVTFTATITPNPSTYPVSGTVTFSAGSNVLGTESVNGNTASITVLGSAIGGVGAHTVTAQFTSNYFEQSGSSGTVVQNINDSAVTSGSNIFTGNQTVNGAVTATSFSGNGASLTNVTAAGLNCAACVTSSMLNVPYALGDAQAGNALNADALGGLGPSAYARVDSNSFTGDQSISGSLTATGNLNGASGSFTGSVTSAGVAVGPTGTATSAQAYNSGPLSASASLYNGSAAQNILFQWQAEPVAASNNTPNPAATLNLLYASSGTPAETGLSVNANGTLNFAPGQTFPGTGDGTITGVSAGTGLTGGGSGGNVSLALATNTCTAGSALTALPFTCAPFVTSGSNVSFGTVSASSFSGNGSLLTGVQAAGIAPGATIADSQVTNLTTDLANASSAAISAADSFATTAANTAQTNAINAAESYANSKFVPLAGGTTGALNASSLTIGGGTPITEYLSVTLHVTLPAINPGECTRFETAALTGFTPGASDTFSLGIPGNLLTGLAPVHGHGPAHTPAHGPMAFLTYQAWETSSSPSTTLSLQVCNSSVPYPGGDAGTIRIDIFKH